MDLSYVTLSVDYTPHRLFFFKEVVGDIELVGDDIADTLAAYHFLRNQSSIDKNKIITLRFKPRRIHITHNGIPQRS